MSYAPGAQSRPEKTDWWDIAAGISLALCLSPFLAIVLYGTALTIDEAEDGPQTRLSTAIEADKANIIHEIKRAHPGAELSQLSASTPMDRYCELQSNTAKNRHRLGDNRVSRDSSLYNCHLYATVNGHKVEAIYFVAVAPQAGWLGRFFRQTYHVEDKWLIKGSTRMEPTHTGRAKN